MVQPPHKQWENLPSCLDHCLVLADRPQGQIFAACYAYIGRRRISGLYVRPTKANVEDDARWENAVLWAAGDSGFRACPFKKPRKPTGAKDRPSFTQTHRNLRRFSRSGRHAKTSKTACKIRQARLQTIPSRQIKSGRCLAANANKTSWRANFELSCPETKRPRLFGQRRVCRKFLWIVSIVSRRTSTGKGGQAWRFGAQDGTSQELPG